jgi:hypothetical protein
MKQAITEHNQIRNNYLARAEITTYFSKIEFKHRRPHSHGIIISDLTLDQLRAKIKDYDIKIDAVFYLKYWIIYCLKSYCNESSLAVYQSHFNKLLRHQPVQDSLLDFKFDELKIKLN